MRVLSSYQTKHIEVWGMGWTHLISLTPTEDSIERQLLEAIEIIGHQHGQASPVCVEHVKSISEIRDEVSIEETYTGIYLVDPLELMDFHATHFDNTPQIFLVTNILFRKLNESFIPAVGLKFEEAISDMAMKKGLYYGLVS